MKMYKGEVHVLVDDEVPRLLEAASEYSFRTEYTVRTLLHTGMRASELAHLKESWLDESGRMPRVRIPMHEDCECSDCTSKAEQSKKHGLDEYWRPKSDSGARVAPVINKKTWDMLKEHVTEHGEVLVSRAAIWERVNKLEDDLDLEAEETLAPHILRHTYGNFMTQRDGVDVENIKEAMGHKSIESTQVYFNLTGDQVTDAYADAFEYDE